MLARMSQTQDRQLTMTAEQVEQRIGLGDRVGAPRQVDHSATFRRHADAVAAAEELAGLGYETTCRRGLFKSSLEFSRVTPVDLETARAFTHEAVRVTEANSGRYDGWGGGVVA
jgi:hypothetical protein